MPGTRAVERIDLSSQRAGLRGPGPWLILAAAEVIAFVLLLTAAFTKPHLGHDEAISYLAACGTQTSWGAGPMWDPPPGGVLSHLSVAALKEAYYEPSGTFNMLEIRRGLARTDLHPPMYFWLLHVAVLLFGVHFWVGPALNTLVVAATGPVMFKLGCESGLSRRTAALGAAIWLLSPVCMIADDARQYSLLCLWATLLAWRSVAVYRSGRLMAQDAPLMALAVAGGWLTHFQFIVFAGCMLLGPAWALRADRRALAHLGTALIIGAGAAFLLHPEFLDSFRRHREWVAETETTDAAKRLYRISLAAVSPVVDPDTARMLLREPWWAAVGVLPIVGAIALRGRLLLDDAAVEDRTPMLFLMGATILFLALLLALYLSGRTLEHAMGRRYLAMAWPAIFLLATAGASSWLGAWRSFAFTLLLLSMPLLTALEVLAVARKESGEAEFRGARALAIDSAARGVLPRVFTLMEPDSVILAAPRARFRGAGEELLAADLYMETHPATGPGTSGAPESWPDVEAHLKGIPVAEVLFLGTLYKPRASD